MFRYSKNRVTRAHEADNILGAKLIDQNRVVLSAVGDDEYYYTLDRLKNIDDIPYNTTLFFEKKEYYEQLNYENLKHNHSDVSLDDEYNSLLDMHYSSTNLFLATTADGSVYGDIDMNFADPLGQNQFSLFASRDDINTTFAGISYTSNQYILNYSFVYSHVVDDNNINYVKDYTAMANISVPFIKSGRYEANFSLSYLEEYDNIREPATLGVDISKYEHFGKSMYPNHLNSLKLYAVKEREDIIYGGKYSFMHELPYEFYVSLNAKYSQTDAEVYTNTNGIKIDTSPNETYDPSQIVIPSLNNAYYGVKTAWYGDISLYKVINLSKYFFTFPISIQRESVYTKYRYYNLEGFSGNIYDMNEVTLGSELGLVGLNSFAFPLRLEYIYNDGDEAIIDNEHSFRVMLGVEF